MILESTPCQSTKITQRERVSWTAVRCGVSCGEEKPMGDDLLGLDGCPNAVTRATVHTPPQHPC